MKGALVGSSVRQTVFSILATLCGCTPALHASMPAVHEAPPSPAKADAPEQEPARAATCGGAGLLASDDTPARGQADLCEQLRRGLVGHPYRDDVPPDEQETVTSVERCSDPIAMPRAPSGSLVPGLMIVNVVGELGELPAEGAYLTVQRAGGLCVADRLLAMEWYHGGHFETDFDVQYPDAHHLTVHAHRLKRVPLEESSEESTDVDWEACETVSYELSDGGGLRRVQARTDEGPCTAP